MLQGPTFDYRSLIEPSRVHSAVYYDERIFQEELERIWYRTWVYVGHESEIPNRNDYVTKSIGPTPILMVRDRSGEVRLLLNKCPASREPAVCLPGWQSHHLHLSLPFLDLQQRRSVDGVCLPGRL